MTIFPKYADMVGATRDLNTDQKRFMGEAKKISTWNKSNHSKLIILYDGLICFAQFPTEFYPHTFENKPPPFWSPLFLGFTAPPLFLIFSRRFCCTKFSTKTLLLEECVALITINTSSRMKDDWCGNPLLSMNYFPNFGHPKLCFNFWNDAVCS